MAKSRCSATLLTTFLDFRDTGILDVFIDEAIVQSREMQMGQGGLKGQELASTFSFLRPNDLVWNYVVGNYLKGETPPPFDLLYWNSDSTNLPGPMYAWYLRNTYLENNLRQAGQAHGLRREGRPAQGRCAGLHLRLARRPHRADRRRLRSARRHLPGKKRFVHGRLRPHRRRDQPAGQEEAQPTGRNDKLPRTTRAEWLEGAKEHPGSWWTDWAGWLKGHAGKQIAAPKTYGKGRTSDRARAGRYVKAKACVKQKCSGPDPGPCRG